MWAFDKKKATRTFYDCELQFEHFTKIHVTESAFFDCHKWILNRAIGIEWIKIIFWSKWTLIFPSYLTFFQLFVRFSFRARISSRINSREGQHWLYSLKRTVMAGVEHQAKKKIKLDDSHSNRLFTLCVCVFFLFFFFSSVVLYILGALSLPTVKRLCGQTKEILLKTQPILMWIYFIIYANKT